MPSLTLFRVTALQAAPLRYKRATNSLIFSTLLPRLYAVRPPRRRVYIVLNISKNLRIPRIRTGFFQIKVGTLPHRYPPPIRIGANYSSTQRYLGNPRSPMSMQCGTAEKFGNLVYFAILSQYNTEGSLQVGCLFLEMKMKQKKGCAITAEPFHRIRFKTTKYQK